jgi:DNA helicase-2/ATP-dependent DNA helicase PcrA
MEHLQGLNEAQKQAILTTEGPVLVLAGAGAGKTRTIAHRIVHIVKGGTPGNAILAITFTNKAAREMRERVIALLTEHGEETASRGTTILTFHALCVQILREFHREAGISRYFTIYDRADSLRAVKKALKEAGEEAIEARTVLSAISRSKGDAKPLAVYREETGNAYFPIVVADAWARYDKIVRADGSLDFDDLLLLTWRLLRENIEVRTALQGRYRYIHVDEYQDTNKVQYEIVRMLAGDVPNLFCVGDLDQNVYSWRGSTIENILEFEHSFPDATILRLEQNYRSTQTIVAVSNDIIKKNRRRKDKTVFTENKEGEKIKLLVGFDERHEADEVVNMVESLAQEGVPLHEMAILYRANFQSRVLEEAFLGAGIPHRVLGTRFFDRKEVKDVLSYIRSALNPESSADILRIINSPTRGIGKTTVAELERVGRNALTGTARTKIDAFFSILDDIRARVATNTASEVLAYALERSGIAKSLSGDNEEDRERLENVKELVSLAVQRYDGYPKPDGLLKLLEESSLATDQDELDQRTEKARDGVVLMTVHAAKGLEFGHVFITGLEDGLFPHTRAEEPGSHVDDEEERRLFYVALTRAKERLYLSYAQVRTVFGVRTLRMPSEFLLEIDEAYIEADAPTGGPREKVVYLD